jgi:hypothetical protein
MFTLMDKKPLRATLLISPAMIPPLRRCLGAQDGLPVPPNAPPSLPLPSLPPKPESSRFPRS